MYIRVECEKVEDNWICPHTRVEVRSFSETSIVFLLWCSTYARLVQSHRKASNHLSFPFLLYFRESGIFSGPFPPPNPGQSGARPEPRGTWRIVAAFRSIFSARLCWLCNILDAHANSRGHPSSLPPMRCKLTRLFSHPIYVIYESLSLGNKLRPVYFRKQVHFL